MIANATIRAVNGLTARRARESATGTVFWAPGVRPPLALLADGAAGTARAESAEALGMA